MSDTNLKLCRYMAGATLVLLALYNLFVQELRSLTDVVILVSSISNVLIAVALFMSNAQFFLIGCGIGAFSCLLSVIACISHKSGIGSVILHASRLAFYVLIMLSFLSQKKNAKLLPIAIIVAFAGPSVVQSLRVIFNDYNDFLETLSFIASYLRSNILWIFPVAIGAFSLDGENVPALTKSISSTSVPKSAGSSIENITKLKELLDMGVISQEEFDAKKKQFLGL